MIDLSNVQAILDAAPPKEASNRRPPVKEAVRRQQVEALYDSGLLPDLHKLNYTAHDMAQHLNAHLEAMGLKPSDKFGSGTIRSVLIERGLVQRRPRKPKVTA